MTFILFVIKKYQINSLPILGCIKAGYHQTNQTFSNTIRMDGQPSESETYFSSLSNIPL